MIKWLSISFIHFTSAYSLHYLFILGMLSDILSKMAQAYRLQVFPVKDQYLQSLEGYESQAILGQCKKHVRKHVLAILTTYMETDQACLKKLWAFKFQVLFY